MTVDQLDADAEGHDQSLGFTPRLIRARAEQISRLIPPGDLLDLGCADGLLTAQLGTWNRRIVAVDGSRVRVERTRRACAHLPRGRVEVRHALFAEFTPQEGESFDTVLLACILEHLEDPAHLLRRAKAWLRSTGRIVAIVPNAHSLHRQAGVHLGLLESLESLGEKDEELHHHRVYHLETLEDDFRRAGMVVETSGGYLIKPLPNDAMLRLDPALIDAFEELGREIPQLAAEIYAVGSCSRPSTDALAS